MNNEQNNVPVKNERGEIQCETCRLFFAPTDLDEDGEPIIQFRPNPYHADVKCDDTCYWLCDNCCALWADEV